MQKNAQLKPHVIYPVVEQKQIGISLMSNHLNLFADQIDVWEIDACQLICEKKIATGSYGDL